MNYRTSSMHKSNKWRAQTDGSAAHKLLSIELDHHHEIQSLLREIKRLRSEVGLMARLRNFHKAQTDRLAEILRKLPPPAIPMRDTPKVADPPNPQKDTPGEERGRPRTREGKGSDKSTSREDGKKRTNEEEKGKDEDTPMTEEIAHTIGENRKDTSSAFPKAKDRNVSRTRAASVVSALRKTRSITKSPAPVPKEEVAKAKKERRKDKERSRKQIETEKAQERPGEYKPGGFRPGRNPYGEEYTPLGRQNTTRSYGGETYGSYPRKQEEKKGPE